MQQIIVWAKSGRHPEIHISRKICAKGAGYSPEGEILNLKATTTLGVSNKISHQYQTSWDQPTIKMKQNKKLPT